MLIYEEIVHPIHSRFSFLFIPLKTNQENKLCENKLCDLIVELILENSREAINPN